MTRANSSHGAAVIKMNKFEEILAEQVRLYRHLYDPSMRDHKDSQMANNSWREIASSVGKEESVCKKVWKNLRDKFVKAKKRGQGKSGDPGGVKYVPPILLELRWMLQFVKHRETDSNMDDEEEQSLAPNQQPESSSSENCLSSSSSSSSSSAVPSPLTLQEYTTPVPPDPSTASKCTTSPCTEAPSPHLNKRKRQTEDVLLKRLKMLDQEREMARQEDNDDHRFGAVLIDMLSEVDPKEKPRVKHKLYQLLFDVLDKQQQNETA